MLNGVADINGVVLHNDQDGLMQKYSLAMSLLDQGLKTIVETLREEKILDTTLLVIMGDHGNELWTQGFHDRRRKNGGMELFCDPLDPNNTSNFLAFAKIDSSGRIIHFGNEEARHPHYLLSMTRNRIKSLVEKYAEFSAMLKKYIQEKQSIARRRTDDVYSLFTMRSFTMIRNKDFP